MVFKKKKEKLPDVHFKLQTVGEDFQRIGTRDYGVAISCLDGMVRFHPYQFGDEIPLISEIALDMGHCTELMARYYFTMALMNRKKSLGQLTHTDEREMERWQKKFRKERAHYLKEREEWFTRRNIHPRLPEVRLE